MEVKGIYIYNHVKKVFINYFHVFFKVWRLKESIYIIMSKRYHLCQLFLCIFCTKIIEIEFCFTTTSGCARKVLAINYFHVFFKVWRLKEFVKNLYIIMSKRNLFLINQ